MMRHNSYQHKFNKPVLQSAIAKKGSSINVFKDKITSGRNTLQEEERKKSQCEVSTSPMFPRPLEDWQDDSQLSDDAHVPVQDQLVLQEGSK